MDDDLCHLDVQLSAAVFKEVMLSKHHTVLTGIHVAVKEHR